MRIGIAIVGLIAAGVLQSPASIRFDDVTAAAGIDFRHVNGASPDHHLQEIMGSGGVFLENAKKASSTCFWSTADRSPARRPQRAATIASTGIAEPTALRT
jgi:hypothetical protein